MNRRLFFTTLAASLLLVGSTICRAASPILAPEEAAKKIAGGKAVLVDVREPEEWASTGVVATAHLLALSDLKGDRKEWKAFLSANKDKEILLYCRSGNRSGQAATLLAGEGYKTANAGGFSAWQKAGIATRGASEPRR